MPRRSSPVTASAPGARGRRGRSRLRPRCDRRPTRPAADRAGAPSPRPDACQVSRARIRSSSRSVTRPWGSTCGRPSVARSWTTPCPETTTRNPDHGTRAALDDQLSTGEADAQDVADAEAGPQSRVGPEQSDEQDRRDDGHQPGKRQELVAGGGDGPELAAQRAGDDHVTADERPVGDGAQEPSLVLGRDGDAPRGAARRTSGVRPGSRCSAPERRVPVRAATAHQPGEWPARLVPG